MPSLRTITPIALLAASCAVQAQVVNGSFEDDAYPPKEPTGWTGGVVLGQMPGTPLVWTPGGVFGGGVLVPALSVFAKEGNCSASIGPGGKMSQAVTVESGRAHELAYWAQSLSGSGVKASLRTRVLDAEGHTLSESNAQPELGGPGASGFQSFRLYVPPVASGKVTVEFANPTTDLYAQAVVDLVSLVAVPRIGPPQVDLPVRSGKGLTLSWSDTQPAHVPQTAPSPEGPWTDVPLAGLKIAGGKRSLELPVDPEGPSLFVRTRPSP